MIDKAIKLPKPSIPSVFSGRLHKTEKVLVEAIVDEEGNVISAKALSGHPFLRATSEAAARASKFSVTIASSKTVKAKTLFTYTFTIAKSRRAKVFVNYVKAEE